MSKLWRVMRTWTGSLHNQDAKVETKTEVWHENLTEDAARLMAKFMNAAQHKRPKHPSLITDGNIFHDPDKFVTELMT
jgi:hypothetical protein